MDVPDDIAYSEIVSVHSFSCEEPFVLSIGCGKYFIAEIPLELEEHLVVVSSTEAGEVLVITNQYRRELMDFLGPLTLYTVDPSASYLARAVKIIARELVENDIKVIDVKVIGNVLDVWGYVLITNGDALSALEIRPAT